MNIPHETGGAFSFLQALVELIIQEDQPTALEDALEVARACESFVDVVSVYSRRANFLLMRDRVSVRCYSLAQA